MLEVEWYGGDVEMSEAEYKRSHYCPIELRPMLGSHVFQSHRAGTDYVHHS